MKMGLAWKEKFIFHFNEFIQKSVFFCFFIKKVKVKYLKTLVERWDEYIKQQQDDLVDYKRDLATLYKPFSFLLGTNIEEKPKEKNKILLDDKIEDPPKDFGLEKS